MAATTIGRDGARVLFRVVGLAHNPVPGHGRSEELVLRVDYVAPRRRAAYGLSAIRSLPYRAAIVRARRDRETYWVDLPRAEDGFAVLQTPQSVRDRLLDAVRDRQIASSDDPQAPASE